MNCKNCNYEMDIYKTEIQNDLIVFYYECDECDQDIKACAYYDLENIEDSCIPNHIQFKE